MTAAAYVERRRTCLAYSPGGHRAELERALEGITFADAFHVTFATARDPRPKGRTYLVCHPRRSLLRTSWNVAQSLRLMLRERPELVISTGADVAVPVFVIGKLIGARTVFIETLGSIEPTLAGKLTYRFADLFVVQWPEKLIAFPRAELCHGLLL